MSRERRIQKRFNLEIPVKVATEPLDQDPPAIQAHITNISTGGTFIRCEHDFPIASKLFIEFFVRFEELAKLQFILSLESLKQLSGKEVKVRATGIVIRVQKDGSAIIFDKNYQLVPL